MDFVAGWYNAGLQSCLGLVFRLPEHVVVLEALLNSWQGCWLGFLLNWGCGIGSVAVQVLWQSLMIEQDW